MKMYKLLLVGMIMALLLTGCDKKPKEIYRVESNTEDTSQESSQQISLNELSQEDEKAAMKGQEEILQVKADKDKKLVNPLLGQSVIYAGEFGEEDNETVKVINSFAENAGINGFDKTKILGVTVADFDSDSEAEGFVYYGFEDEQFISGEWYFVKANNVELIYNQDVYGFDGYIDCGNKKMAYVNEYYTTSDVSRIFEVIDGHAVETNISGIGSINATDIKNTTIAVSRYDATYDLDLESFMGHTWNPYYFYYDDKEGIFKEYVGEKIAASADANDPEGAFAAKLDELCGFDIYEQIAALEYSFSDAYIRDNGILNINMYIEYESSFDYSNISYDCKHKKFVNTWEDNVNTVAEAICDGIYEAAIMPEE